MCVAATVVRSTVAFTAVILHKLNVRVIIICIKKASHIVCTHESEFPYRRSHSPIKFAFIDINFCVGSGIGLFQAPFYAYAMVINEVPGKPRQ